MPIPKKSKPIVAIVGRPNVGKSAIFNRLANRRIAIVHDQPGVTRDRLSADCEPGRVPFELVDTGGIGAPLEDGFADQVRAEADIAMAAADLILFTVDGRQGITPVDQDLAQRLHGTQIPVLLLVNKMDTEKVETAEAEFSALGFRTRVPVSAAHGRNFKELVRLIDGELTKVEAARISQAQEDAEDFPEIPSGDSEPVYPLKMAIVGRPNVGKSSLINALLNDSRTIVSDIAGTTRDSVDVPYERDGKPYLLIDTAGLRRRMKRDTSVEVFSAMRTEKAIRRADLCLLVIDANAGITTGDRRIARTILEENKPCLVLLNKFDLFHPDGHFRDRVEHLQEMLGDGLFFLHYAPHVAVSALKREYLGKIFQAVQKVRDASDHPVGTGALNRTLHKALEKNPPPLKGRKRLKLLYATQQREDRPRAIQVPRIMLFVNHKDLLPKTYERYLENHLRDAFPLEGLPIVFDVRSRREDEEEGPASKPRPKPKPKAKKKAAYKSKPRTRQKPKPKP